MSYVASNLIPGEDVIFATKKHWIVFLWPVIFLVLGLSSISHGGAFWLFLAVVMGVGATLSYMTSEFAVTNKRLIVKAGLIRRRTLDVANTKVEGVAANETILGRLLGYQTLVVRGTGGTPQSFHRVAKASDLRRNITIQTTRPGETHIVGTVNVAIDPSSIKTP